MSLVSTSIYLYQHFCFLSQGERVSLAITLLLAMTVFMLVVADMIPPTSDVIPLVGIFFNAAMSEMVLMIISLCVVLRLYHKQPLDPPMGSWVRKYILEGLSFTLGVRHRPTATGTSQQLVPQQHKPSIELKYVASGRQNGATEIHQSTPLMRPQQPVRQCISSGLMHRKWDKTGQASPELFDKTAECNVISRKMDIIIDKMSQKEKDEKVKLEWRIVAMTMDRCLLVSFFFITVFMIAVIFLNSPGYVS